MNVLTDCPQAVAAMCRQVRRVPADELTGPERAVWQALSPAPTLAAGATPGPLEIVAVIESAPRSQFAALLDALHAGAVVPGDFATVALEGRGFKGQRERAWSAHRGNLHLCVYYRLDQDASQLGLGLNVLPAIAAAAAIRRVTGHRLAPGIKWVNDILVDGRKVAGVLTATQARSTTIEHVLFGIGVNVAVAPAIPPTPFVPAPGCLGRGLTWHDVLVPLLDELHRGVQELLTEGPAQLVEAYRADSIALGRFVRIWPEGTTDLAHTPPTAEGIVTAIEDDLALRVDGVPHPIHAGRLALVP